MTAATEEQSESIQRSDGFAFYTFVAAAGQEIGKVFGPAARPMNLDTVDAIATADAERDRQFRLGQVTRTAFHHSGLADAIVENADLSSDPIAVGFRAGKMKTDAAVP